MANEMSTSEKQYIAKILFTREKLDQKVIAEKVGVSEATISKWVNTFNWRRLRDRLLVGKEEVLNNLYEQLANLNEAIRIDKVKKGIPDSKQADIQIKLTASIRNLETELSIGDAVEAGMRFIKHIQELVPHDKVIEVADLWNGFIQQSIKSNA